MHRNSIVPISEDADIERATTRTSELAQYGMFDPKDTADLVTIVSELTRNILRYADRGHCHLTVSGTEKARRFEIMCTDSGPGISDIQAAMEEGFSSGSGLGLGLPGVKKLADDLDVKSTETGTRVRAQMTRQVGSAAATPRKIKIDSLIGRDPINTGYAVQGYMKGPISGDRGGIWRLSEHQIRLCLSDGLGHGEDAKHASDRAIDWVANNLETSFDQIFTGLNPELEDTRGAAIACADICLKENRVTFAGIGNIQAALVDARIHHLGSNNGIVGTDNALPSFETRVMRKDDFLVLWSDGLPALLDLVPFRRQRGTVLQSLATRLVNEHALLSDDASILMLRITNKMLV